MWLDGIPEPTRAKCFWRGPAQRQTVPSQAKCLQGDHKRTPQGGGCSGARGTWRGSHIRDGNASESEEQVTEEGQTKEASESVMVNVVNDLRMPENFFLLV